MRKQKNMFQIKTQDKISEKDLSDMKISNLPDKEFKVIVIKMLTKLRRVWMNTVRTSEKKQRDLPGGPVVKTLRFHCRGMCSIPGQGPKIPHATWHGQKKRERE